MITVDLVLQLNGQDCTLEDFDCVYEMEIEIEIAGGEDYLYYGYELYGDLDISFTLPLGSEWCISYVLFGDSTYWIEDGLRASSEQNPDVLVFYDIGDYIMNENISSDIGLYMYTAHVVTFENATNGSVSSAGGEICAPSQTYVFHGSQLIDDQPLNISIHHAGYDHDISYTYYSGIEDEYVNDGYSFLGFSDSTSEEDIFTSYTVTSNCTIYGIFRGYVITITFDNQNATSAGTTAIYYEYGIDKYYSNSVCTSTYEIIRITKPTKTGYTFMAYGVAPSLGPPTYIDSDGKFKNNLYAVFTGDTTLYAVWEANSYTISYTLNGGTAGSSAPTSATYDSVVNISNPTRTGYTFNGWSISGLYIGYAKYGTSSSAVDTHFSSPPEVVKATYFKNLTCLNGNTITFTAVWAINSYTISYTLNGGTAGTSAPTSATYDTGFTVSNPTRTGYTFNGWNITGMDSCTHYYGTSSSSNSTSTATSLSNCKSTWFNNLRATSGTVTFAAQWTANTYTISYTLNGGTAGTNAPTSATYDISSNVSYPTRTGYTFNGWNITGMDSCAHYHGTLSTAYIVSTTETSLANCKSVDFKNLRATSGTVNFAAQWTVNSYTISVYPNSGTLSTKYTYNGTSQSGGSSGLFYLYCNYGSTTLYAMHNGTKCALTSLTGSRTGYTYKGLYTAASGGTQKVTATGYALSSTISANTSLYAQWTANTYTITIKVNNSSYGSVSNTSVAGVPYGATISAFSVGDGKTISGLSVNGTNVTATAATATNSYTYSFSKWTQTSTSGTQITYTGITVTGAMTIYANFTAVNNYKVTVTKSASSTGMGNILGSPIYVASGTTYSTTDTSTDIKIIKTITFSDGQTITCSMAAGSNAVTKISVSPSEGTVNAVTTISVTFTASGSIGGGGIISPETGFTSVEINVGQSFDTPPIVDYTMTTSESEVETNTAEVWLDDKFRKLQELPTTEVDFEGITLGT